LRRYVVGLKERTNLFLKDWLDRSDRNIVRILVFDGTILEVRGTIETLDQSHVAIAASREILAILCVAFRTEHR
jgi:hypothetical protein